MSIVKDLEIKISNGEARLSEDFYVYQNDGGVELRLKLNLIRRNYRSAIRSSLFEADELYAGATILKPNGEVIPRSRIKVVDNIISFVIDKEFTDHVDEIGIYKIQFHLYDIDDNRITIPPIQFEVKELIANIDEDSTVIDHAKADKSRVDFCVVANDGESMQVFSNGKYIRTVWNSGDLITSVKLNKIEEGVETLSDKLSDVLTDDDCLNIEKIPYFTANDSNITSVKDALDKLLYSDLVINLSSTSSTTVEIGTTLSSVVFNWTYSKQVISQSFNGTSLDKSIRTYTYNSSFNSNKTFTLNANDGTKNFSKSIGFSFLNGRYWGVSSAMSYDNDLIRNFSKELSSSKSKTFTVNCGKGQHIFYCVPTRFGSCSFKVGGFEGGFNKVSTIQYTNSSGYTENYDVYKSSNSNLGNTTVVVS